MFHPSRGGVRGGQDQFSWDSVKDDKHRENYLGNSLNAPVGRWQNGKDLTWYAKSGASNNDVQSRRQQELQAIKEAEADAMAQALGSKTSGPRLGKQLSERELAMAMGRPGERVSTDNRSNDSAGDSFSHGVGFKRGGGGGRNTSVTGTNMIPVVPRKMGGQHAKQDSPPPNIPASESRSRNLSLHRSDTAALSSQADDFLRATLAPSFSLPSRDKERHRDHRDDRSGRQDRPSGHDRAGRNDRQESQSRGDMHDRRDRLDRSERSDVAQKSEWTDRKENMDRKEGPLDRSGRHEHRESHGRDVDRSSFSKGHSTRRRETSASPRRERSPRSLRHSERERSELKPFNKSRSPERSHDRDRDHGRSRQRSVSPAYQRRDRNSRRDVGDRDVRRDPVEKEDRHDRDRVRERESRHDQPRDRHERDDRHARDGYNNLR